MVGVGAMRQNRQWLQQQNTELVSVGNVSGELRRSGRRHERGNNLNNAGYSDLATSGLETSPVV